ncbi:helix-turn-helix domain-containing protein [Mariprofundus ferrooxydans]|uniref:Transcriptional regulator, XRE family protein n=1 Tax=Mariprofundus ferrooxydans PV-1 TaxID=314345 RepID=Q0F2U3_9PROT|nr:helix-turn-helix domain-containing protein [Mariprofundus ferrooxydans]EAU56198.1 transcriptional regulator, XRE family protein [Mariprofundus ferrooxydans PV-1]KON48041.1 XRE family transcriptional regulator [Mariprofundus ferrooxydans]
MSHQPADEMTDEHNEADQVTQPAGNPDVRQTLLTDIGNKLTAARLALQEGLDEPARKLKLRRKHLEALESGNWDSMPDDVYAMGFLRQYSAYLRLDLTDEVERLKNSAYTLTRPLTFPDPPVAPSRQWAWIASALFIILLIAFNVLYQQAPENHSPAVVTMSAPNTAEAPVVESSPPAQTTAPISPPAEPASKPDDKTPGETVGIVTEQTTQTAPTVATTRSTTQAIPKPARKTVTPQPPTTHTYRFEAVGSSVWIQISMPNPAGDGKGRLIKEALLQQGHHISLKQPVDALWITCGNAPSLRILVDGKLLADTGSLGAGKKVLRDQRISSNRGQ